MHRTGLAIITAVAIAVVAVVAIATHITASCTTQVQVLAPQLPPPQPPVGGTTVAALLGSRE